jgi:X-X-X-Leu-X-X-Gly heptad repeat protein
MNTLIKDTFGPASIGLVSTLATNLNQVADANKSLQASSGGKLDLTFGLTSQQLNFKLKKLETESKNALTGFGLLLLPTVETLANWTQGAVKYFDKHPLIQKIATDATIGIFATAVVYKLASGLGKLFGGLGKIAGGVKSVVTGEQAVTQISLLTEIAANTAAMVGEGTVEIGELAGGKTGIIKGIMSKLPAATLAELVPPLIGVVGAAYVGKTLMDIPGKVQGAASQISSGSYLPQGKPMTGPYPSNGYYLNLGNGQSLFVPGSGAKGALSPTAGAGKTKVTLKATVK